MKIETKFNIGERIWVVYKEKGEVSVYSDTISEIGINESGCLYWLKDSDCLELKEEDIISYDDTEELLERIIMFDKSEEQDINV